jgi:hypothetical protein
MPGPGKILAGGRVVGLLEPRLGSVRRDQSPARHGEGP